MILYFDLQLAAWSNEVIPITVSLVLYLSIASSMCDITSMIALADDFNGFLLTGGAV